MESGYINYFQFLNALMPLFTGEFIEKMKFIFNILDCDNDQFINCEDIRLFLSHIPLDTINSESLKNYRVEGEISQLEKSILFIDRFQSQQEIGMMIKHSFEGKTLMSFSEFKILTLTKSSDLFLAIYLLFRGQLPIQKHLDMVFYEIKINQNQNQNKTIKNKITDVSSPKHLSKMTPIHSLLNECMIQRRREIIRTPKHQNKILKLNYVKEVDRNLTFSSYISPTYESKKNQKSKFYQDNPENVNDNENGNVNEENIISKINNKNNKEINAIEELKGNNFDNGIRNDQDPTFSKSLRMILCLYCCNKFKSIEDSLCPHCKFNKLKIKNSGFLYIISKKNVLKKYYFVLHFDEPFGYIDLERTKLKEVHILSKVFMTISNIVELEGKKLYPFTINYKISACTFFTEEKDERDNWILHIEETIKNPEMSKFYGLKEKLGEGKSGEVRKAIHLTTKKEVAIKILNKKAHSESKLFRTRNEIEILKLCQHPNIMNLIDVFESKEQIFIVLENLTGGELYKYFEKRSYRLSEQRVKKLFHSLATALYYLKRMGIVHRDIKLENLMLADKTEDSDIKIVDLGFAAIYVPGLKLEEPLGTIIYASPEICLNLPYNFQTDIWSLGICLFILLSGTLPFDNKDIEKLKYMIISEEPKIVKNSWAKISQDAIDLVKRMLEKDPNKRITIEEVLIDKWILKDNPELQEIRNSAPESEKFKAFSLSDPQNPKALTEGII